MGEWRWGHSTPEVETAWKGGTGGSQSGGKVSHGALLARARAEGGKGGGEGIRSMGRRADGRVPKRRKRRGEGVGFGMGVRVGIESLQGVRKRGSAQCMSTMDAA